MLERWPLSQPERPDPHELGSLWVAVLNISHATQQKILSKHLLDAVDVMQAVQCVRGLQFTWDDDPDRGCRALVRTWVRGKPVLIVLYPTDEEGVFNLGSAYPTG